MPEQTPRQKWETANQRERDAKKHGNWAAGTFLGGQVAGGTALVAHEHAANQSQRAAGAYHSGSHETLPELVRSVKRAKLVRNIGGGVAAASVPVVIHQAVKSVKAQNDSRRLRREALVDSMVAKAIAAELSKHDTTDALPGDNKNAQAARRRRKAGLTLAGAGWLTASRSHDVADPAAHLITLPAAKNADEVAHKLRAEKVTARTQKIKNIATRGGAVAIGGGLLLAGEGAINDLRHRKVVHRMTQKARETAAAPVRKSVSPVRLRVRDTTLAKAFDAELAKYEKGSITYHQEQADLHARKKASADRRMKAGAATVPVALAAGAGVQHAAKTLGPKWAAAAGSGHDVLYRTHGGPLKSSGAGADRVLRRVKIARGAYLAGGIGGPVVAAGGLAVAGHGLAGRIHHGRKQNEETKAAQLARKSRNAAVAKAFDSERSRHNRQAAYTGLLAGGAVVAGGHGLHREKVAQETAEKGKGYARQSAATHDKVQGKLHSMGQPGAAVAPPDATNAARLHRKAEGLHRVAQKYEAGAKKLKLMSRGTLAGAAVLGAGAVGVHRYDRHHGGRSFGY